MFSDDDLMQRLVLKGGNLLAVVFGVSSRGSLDLDFSIENEFENLDVFKEKITRVLSTTFEEEGFVVFDVNIREVPLNLISDMKPFWGGYQIDFKLIEKHRYAELVGDPQRLRMGQEFSEVDHLNST